MRFIPALAFTLLFLPLAVDGHGTGASIEEEVDEYLIDIGYAPETVIARGQVRIDFDIFDAASKDPIPFTDLWLRIERGNMTYFAAGIAKAEFGRTGVVYSFPEAGEYTLSVRFQDSSEVLVEHEVPFAVNSAKDTPSSSSSALMFSGGVLGGLLLGFLAARLLRRG